MHFLGIPGIEVWGSFGDGPLAITKEKPPLLAMFFFLPESVDSVGRASIAHCSFGALPHLLFRFWATSGGGVVASPRAKQRLEVSFRRPTPPMVPKEPDLGLRPQGASWAFLKRPMGSTNVGFVFLLGLKRRPNGKTRPFFLKSLFCFNTCSGTPSAVLNDVDQRIPT